TIQILAHMSRISMGNFADVRFNKLLVVAAVSRFKNKMPYGRVRNAAGTFVKTDLASVTTAAGSAVKHMPPDFRVSITNAHGSDAYPIASFTWLLIPSKISDPEKRNTINDFLKWMLTDGQKMVEALSYPRLPAEVVAMETKAIGQIQ